MSKFFKKGYRKAGLSPGTLVHVGKKRSDKIKITVIDYDESEFTEKNVKTVEECFKFRDKPTVTWINIDGLHDLESIEKLGKNFGIHSLVLEDIVNTNQRPKLEDFEDYIFLVLKMLYVREDDGEVHAEQISMILGKTFVISFQEQEGDIFDNIRERIRSGKGRIRKLGADYLAYSLMDAIVDNYFLILEKFGETIEEREEELVSNPDPETLQDIYSLKRELIFLRKSVWPLREVISGLERQESPLIQESTDIYLRDVYDHTIQVIDTIETYRDMVSGMLDMYLSSISNRMNEIMKVLTIIATIFIPLTFIAGIYGMNFNPDASPLNMPELNWYWGYPAIWTVMLSVGLIMYMYFRRKKWM
ncbi:MAG: magnesium/cobalt transporter CorA [Candidatus Altiarchaeota archaeon]